MRRMTFAFRVFGMSVTNTISFGASALPRSWATLALNSAARPPSAFVAYRARKHGLGNGRCGKCGEADCVAAAAVSVSALRRELSRPHQHRLRDPRDERRSRPDRFNLWQRQRHFLHRLLRAANSRGPAGGALERAMVVVVNADHLGCAHNSHCICPHSAPALRCAVLLGAAEAGFFPGVIVYLSHWFIYEDRAKAVARFMSAIPIAYILVGPLPGAI